MTSINLIFHRINSILKVGTPVLWPHHLWRWDRVWDVHICRHGIRSCLGNLVLGASGREEVVLYMKYIPKKYCYAIACACFNIKKSPSMNGLLVGNRFLAWLLYISKPLKPPSFVQRGFFLMTRGISFLVHGSIFCDHIELADLIIIFPWSACRVRGIGRDLSQSK